jgi:hypothetical protein
VGKGDRVIVRVRKNVMLLREMGKRAIMWVCKDVVLVREKGRQGFSEGT